MLLTALFITVISKLILLWISFLPVLALYSCYCILRSVSMLRSFFFFLSLLGQALNKKQVNQENSREQERC